jgi:hypothetical protein
MTTRYEETVMACTMTPATLTHENVVYLGSGGRSQENRGSGFRPAFLDADTGLVHPSRFADGRLAPLHLLDGLPDGVVLARGADGRVIEVKASLVSGFSRDGRFYTRDEAMRAMQAEPDWEMAA